METGAFERFAKGNIYAAFLRLAPGEDSSGPKTKKMGLVKARNGHLRKLLIEAVGSICKGMAGHKSKDLNARQRSNIAEIIAYADRANTRLRSRYYKFTRHVKARNVAVAVICQSRVLRTAKAADS